MNAKLYLSAAAITLAFSSAGVYAADTIRITVDKDYLSRTNMSTERTDGGELKTSFDPGFTDRTNMKRPAGESSAVTVSRDPAFLSRTNMNAPEQPATQTAGAKR